MIIGSSQRWRFQRIHNTKQKRSQENEIQWGGGKRSSSRFNYERFIIRRRYRSQRPICRPPSSLFFFLFYSYLPPAVDTQPPEEEEEEVHGKDSAYLSRWRRRERERTRKREITTTLIVTSILNGACAARKRDESLFTVMSRNKKREKSISTNWRRARYGTGTAAAPRSARESWPGERGLISSLRVGGAKMDATSVLSPPSFLGDMISNQIDAICPPTKRESS